MSLLVNTMILTSVSYALLQQLTIKNLENNFYKSILLIMAVVILFHALYVTILFLLFFGSYYVSAELLTMSIIFSESFKFYFILAFCINILF